MVMSYQIGQPLLADADAEARRLGHQFIAPEHLLLAAAAIVGGAGRTFCERHGLTPEALREVVAALHGPAASATVSADGPLPIVLRSQVALAHAVLAGKRRGDPRFTPDELLVALLHDDVAPHALVGAILEGFGLTPAAARDEIAGLGASPAE